MKNFIFKVLSSGLGLGYIPVAPGTFGTLWGSVIYYYFRNISHPVFIIFILVFAAVSIVVAHFGEKAFKQKDCQKIVIDEVAGVLFCYALLPYSLFHLVMGFVLFRIFDIAKLTPAKQAQSNLSGGLGVVADDLVAGLQGGLILFALPFLMRGAESALKWIDQMI